MAPVTLRIDLENRADELDRLADWFDRVDPGVGLPTQVLFDLKLAVYEAVANVMAYGFAPNADGHGIAVTLTADLAGRFVAAVIEDDGLPFDPVAQPDPPLGTTLADAPISGRGIPLIKRLCAGVAYQRTDGRNRLTLTGRIGP